MQVEVTAPVKVVSEPASDTVTTPINAVDTRPICTVTITITVTAVIVRLILTVTTIIVASKGHRCSSCGTTTRNAIHIFDVSMTDCKQIKQLGLKV